MTYIKKCFSVFLCFILLITAVSSLTLNSSAATSGRAKSSTITVTSKANYWYPGASSITLTQQKQTLTYKSLFSNKTTTKTGYYGYYNISVFNITKRKTDNQVWGGGKSKKIELSPNCTYRITVSYNSVATSTFTKPPRGYSWKKSSTPSWKVSSTWKVSSYK